MEVKIAVDSTFVVVVEAALLALVVELVGRRKLAVEALVGIAEKASLAGIAEKASLAGIVAVAFVERIVALHRIVASHRMVIRRMAKNLVEKLAGLLLECNLAGKLAGSLVSVENRLGILANLVEMRE